MSIMNTSPTICSEALADYARASAGARRRIATRHKYGSCPSCDQDAPRRMVLGVLVLGIEPPDEGVIRAALTELRRCWPTL